MYKWVHATDGKDKIADNVFHVVCSFCSGKGVIASIASADTKRERYYADCEYCGGAGFVHAIRGNVVISKEE